MPQSHVEYHVMTIGLLGGTFDPVHNGHLRLAIECREQLSLRQVRLLPVFSPPHRAAPVAAPGQRLEMVRLAVAGTPGLAADDAEIGRGGTSFTIDTLRGARSQLGNDPLALIMGADAFAGLANWREWTGLFDLAHIIVVDRPGSAGKEPAEEVKEIVSKRQIRRATQLHQAPAGSLYRATLPLLDIASSDIRARCLEGRSIRGLVPDAVHDYIDRQSLYRGPA